MNVAGAVLCVCSEPGGALHACFTLAVIEAGRHEHTCSKHDSCWDRYHTTSGYGGDTAVGMAVGRMSFV